MNLRSKSNFLILIPVLVAFLIALIPTLKYQWPLSWDIIFHIEYANFYNQHGFVLQKNYPPLFHFLIAFLGNVLDTNYFQIARFLQPFLAASIVLSVSYVTKKLYGNLAGISAGFLVISSYMAFRIMMPLPENLALIFLIFSVYFYYNSIIKNNMKYAGISGILLIMALLTHRTVPLFLILIISLFTLLELTIYRNKSVLKNYGVFLSFIFILVIGGVTTLLLWKPELLTKIFQQGMSTYMVYITSYINLAAYNKSISIFKYISFLGVFVSLFSLIGGIISVKMKSKKGIFLSAWIIVVFLISEAHWFGFNIESVRFLIYMLIPLSILGGYGLSYVYSKLKEYPRFSSSNFRLTFLIGIFALSLFMGVLTTEKTSTIYAKDSLGNVQIAPPSTSEADLANWFNQNGDKKKNLIISNRYSGIFLSAATGMQVNSNFGSFDRNTPKSIFDKKNIGYIVYDKKLTFSDKNGTFYRKEAITELNKGSKLFYYNGDIHANINKIIPSFAKVVYENNGFIVCKV